MNVLTDDRRSSTGLIQMDDDDDLELKNNGRRQRAVGLMVMNIKNRMPIG